MCLIIHKPADARIPEDLLVSALSLSHGGWGLMGFATDGALLLERHAKLDAAELLATVRRLPDAEYALHLRRRTHGDAGEANAHPFKVVNGVYLMHNGTLEFDAGQDAPGRSDTWRLVHHYLRPLEQRWPGLLRDTTMQSLLELGLQPENRVALLLESARRIVILNRSQGREFEGLWLSGTRWVDRRLLPLDALAQPQERSFAAGELRFM